MGVRLGVSFAESSAQTGIDRRLIGFRRRGRKIPLCIFCGTELTADTKPEHILLNALGGRKTTQRVICSGQVGTLRNFVVTGRPNTKIGLASNPTRLPGTSISNSPGRSKPSAAIPRYRSGGGIGTRQACFASSAAWFGVITPSLPFD
jgi:hypothetical protein